MAVRPWSSWIPLVGLLALTVASAAWSVSTSPTTQRHVATHSTVATPSTTVTRSTPLSPSQTPVARSPGVNPGTTIVQYPNPYAPSYDTLQSLVSDASFIVLATVLPQSPATNNYPLKVQRSFLYEARSSMAISPQEFDAAHLSVGSTYLFFWADDPIDSTYCIVGGVRGVFDYDPSDQTITRIDQSAASQIPETQTLEQFGTAVATAATALQTSATRSLPPVCTPSATGIS